jgi:hypothetical protein
MPYGVRATTKFVVLATACPATFSTASKGAFSATPISAVPTTMLNSTTAGTTLLASE